jgi:hypothetical protein
MTARENVPDWDVITARLAEKKTFRGLEEREKGTACETGGEPFVVVMSLVLADAIMLFM